MKAYWGSGGIASRILDLGTEWRWVVSLTPRPLYTQVHIGWAPEPVWTLCREKFPASARTRTTDHPARSPALYRWADPALRKTSDTQNNSVTIDRPTTRRTPGRPLKETNRWIQSWGRNRSLVRLTSWPEDDDIQILRRGNGSSFQSHLILRCNKLNFSQIFYGSGALWNIS
jgi:hypothetical protein